MKLLIDTDAFCKLGIAGLLEDVVRLLGTTLAESARLPALPHMLKRGKLRRTFGEEPCNALLAVAETIPTIPEASADWLGELVNLDGVDPGEALLLAVAAERGLLLVSGDKRALRSVRYVERLVHALCERVVVMEAALLSVCASLGVEVVRIRMVPLVPTDTMVRVCFSGATDPRDALLAYYESACQETHPLTLWRPS